LGGAVAQHLLVFNMLGALVASRAASSCGCLYLDVRQRLNRRGTVMIIAPRPALALLTVPRDGAR
jgi:hypothetical protein